MEYLPVMLNVAHRLCLVVGGGRVAARRVELLTRAGAQVRLVAPELCPELQRQLELGPIDYIAAPFHPDWLEDCALVITATDSSEINRWVGEEARWRGLPVNIVDDTGASSIVIPAIVDRSPLLVAVSTCGRSPSLARVLRRQLEMMFPTAYGRVVEWAGSFRDTVRQRFRTAGERQRFWEHVCEGPLTEQVLAGQAEEANRQLQAALNEGSGSETRGEVYLVGAGPGDPDLLTLKAQRLMQRADAVIYDRLVAPELLERVRPDAEQIFAGKSPHNHPLPQEEINTRLVALAHQGKRVLRLKGGDPFLFGRGGEEIATLKEAGIPFQVVPGITAALGCAAYAGIPLTHRDYAQACVFVTGHLRDGSLDLPWQSLIQPDQTVVVYMGVRALPQLCQGLIHHGLPGEWPAAVIEHGTTGNQRVIPGTLDQLPQLAETSGLRSPSLAIIGQVVELRDRLNWFSASTPADLDRSQALQ